MAVPPRKGRHQQVSPLPASTSQSTMSHRALTKQPRISPDQNLKMRKPYRWLERPLTEGELHPSPNKKMIWAWPNTPPPTTIIIANPAAVTRAAMNRCKPYLGIGSPDSPPPVPLQSTREEKHARAEPRGGGFGRGRRSSRRSGVGR